MKSNRRILTTLALIGLLVACSKSSDPAASTECNITFKGTKYAISDIAICVTLGTAESIGGGTGSTGVTINISRQTDDATANVVIFSIGTGANDNYFASDGLPSTPAINVSGKTWTYSGTAANAVGDSGTFSGTCTCKN